MQRDEEDDALELVDAVEPGREGHCEQEREQHLHAGEHHTQLLQELVEVPVQAILRRLPHVPRSLRPGRRLRDPTARAGRGATYESRTRAVQRPPDAADAPRERTSARASRLPPPSASRMARVISRSERFSRTIDSTIERRW